MNREWFMCYAEYALRAIDIETNRLELRGWITKNGKHIFIGDDGGGPSSGASGKAGKKLDKSAESGIMKSDKRFELDDDKIIKFLLAPGAKHSKEFFDVGYSQTDYQKLYDDISKGFDMKKAFDFRNKKFSIYMQLGIKKAKQFRTVWQNNKQTNKPRFITAHREG